MDVTINCHRRTRVDLHAVCIKDRVTPEGENLLLKDPADAGDDVMRIVRIS